MGYDRSAKDLKQFQGEGFQVIAARRPHKDVPAWAQSYKALERHIMADARRRVRIAYLYWHMRYTAKEVAADVGESISAVKSTLHRLAKSRE